MYLNNVYHDLERKHMLSYKSERFNKRTFVESYICSNQDLQSVVLQVIGTLRYGHHGLRTISGRESPSHAWTVGLLR